MKKLTIPFIGLSAGMLVAAPWIINAAPFESTMGLVQKVFYFHFPAAILFMTAAVVCGINSARVLFWKNQRADAWAVAAAELGFLFGAITLVTGPLWARKAWGVWWVWDARLTMSLVLWMIFGAYMLWAISRFVYESWKFKEVAQGMIPIPIWIPQSALVIGSAIFLIAVLDEFARVLRNEKPVYQVAEEARRAAGDYSETV